MLPRRATTEGRGAWACGYLMRLPQGSSVSFSPYGPFQASAPDALYFLVGGAFFTRWFSSSSILVVVSHCWPAVVLSMGSPPGPRSSSMSGAPDCFVPSLNSGKCRTSLVMAAVSPVL